MLLTLCKVSVFSSSRDCRTELTLATSIVDNVGFVEHDAVPIVSEKRTRTLTEPSLPCQIARQPQFFNLL